jgi:hypothetical protein
MSTPYGIVESPPNNWSEIAILKFAPEGFRYSLIGLLALSQNHRKSWPVIPTLSLSHPKKAAYDCVTKNILSQKKTHTHSNVT